MMPSDVILIADCAWYSPATGHVWSSVKSSLNPKGLPILMTGRNSVGYAVVTRMGHSEFIHRLAWTKVNGPIPDGRLIDHINGDRGDNRIANLRLVSLSENNQKRKPQRNNTSGYAGVTRLKKAWIAQITINGRSRYLGSYENKESAYSAYITAKIKAHGPVSVTHLPKTLNQTLIPNK